MDSRRSAAAREIVDAGRLPGRQVQRVQVLETGMQRNPLDQLASEAGRPAARPRHEYGVVRALVAGRQASEYDRRFFLRKAAGTGTVTFPHSLVGRYRSRHKKQATAPSRFARFCTMRLPCSSATAFCTRPNSIAVSES